MYNFHRMSVSCLLSLYKAQGNETEFVQFWANICNIETTFKKFITAAPSLSVLPDSVLVLMSVEGTFLLVFLVCTC